MKKIIAALFVLAIILGIKSADACSVMAGYPGTIAETYGRSDVVFVGTVSSVIQDKSVYGDYRIQFKVSKTYKGKVDDTVIVSAPGSSAACGYDDALSVFKKGTVWVIYANGELRTTSVTKNTQYETVGKATAELDAALNVEEPTFCTQQYAPVCGRKSTGIMCITAPCPSHETKTYGNSCMLGVAKAEYLYEGECRPEDVEGNQSTPGNPGAGVPPKGTITATGSVQIDTSGQGVTTTATTSFEGEVSIKSFGQKVKDFFVNLLFFWR